MALATSLEFPRTGAGRELQQVGRDGKLSTKELLCTVPELGRRQWLLRHPLTSMRRRVSHRVSR